MEHNSLDNNAVMWPVPPHYYFADGAELLSSEPCLVDLRNGKEVAGFLLLFSAEYSRILFQPENGNANEIILFDQIKCLKLTRQVVLLREQVFFETLADKDTLPPEKLSYVVEFSDSTNATGFTSGFVNAEAGLYVYPQDVDEIVARHFIPRYLIKSYKIGVPIDGLSIEDDSAATSAIEGTLEYKNVSPIKSIDDYLIKNQINTVEELKQAITQQESLPVIRLGNALKRAQLLTDDQLQAALEKQKQTPTVRLGQILIGMGIIDEPTLNSVLAKKLGILYVNLANFDFDPKATGIVSESLARKLSLMPLCIHGNKLVAAFVDPLNAQAIDELGFDVQMPVLSAMSSREDILSAIDTSYNQTASGLASGGMLGGIKLNSDGSIDFE